MQFGLKPRISNLEAQLSTDDFSEDEARWSSSSEFSEYGSLSSNDESLFTNSTLSAYPSTPRSSKDLPHHYQIGDSEVVDAHQPSASSHAAAPCSSLKKKRMDARYMSKSEERSPGVTIGGRALAGRATAGTAELPIIVSEIDDFVARHQVFPGDGQPFVQ